MSYADSNRERNDKKKAADLVKDYYRFQPRVKAEDTNYRLLLHYAKLLYLLPEVDSTIIGNVNIDSVFYYLEHIVNNDPKFQDRIALDEDFSTLNKYFKYHTLIGRSVNNDADLSIILESVEWKNSEAVINFEDGYCQVTSYDASKCSSQKRVRYFSMNTSRRPYFIESGKIQIIGWPLKHGIYDKIDALIDNETFKIPKYDISFTDDLAN